MHELPFELSISFFLIIIYRVNNRHNSVTFVNRVLPYILISASFNLDVAIFFSFFWFFILLKSKKDVFIQMCKNCRLVCLVGFVRRSLAGRAAVICNLSVANCRKKKKKRPHPCYLFTTIDILFFFVLAAADFVYFANWQFICVELG